LTIFQLPAVKLLEALTNYANTNKETFSLFIDSSIDNVLLQTYQPFLDFTNIPKLYPLQIIANSIKYYLIFAIHSSIDQYKF